jgi:hypothetical protein
MNTPPDKIYLQFYGDQEPPQPNEQIEVGNVSWCQDSIFEYDIPYLRADKSMTTDTLTHQLARALCKMPIMTKLQEDIKFTALENYFNHYKRFNASLDSDVIDYIGDDINMRRIERKQA